MTSGDDRAPARLVPIGEVARHFGVSVSALRYYDELGLLPPAERRASGRRYGPPELRRLALIQLLQHGGLSLDEIAEVLAGPDAGRTWREILDTRLGEIDAQIAQAQATRAALDHLRQCPDHDPVRECPIIAAQLAERVTAALATGSGAPAADGAPAEPERRVPSAP